MNEEKKIGVCLTQNQAIAICDAILKLKLIESAERQRVYERHGEEVAEMEEDSIAYLRDSGAITVIANVAGVGTPPKVQG